MLTQPALPLPTAACSNKHAAAVEQLLALGADPAAGSDGSGIAKLQVLGGTEAAAAPFVLPFLRRGMLDPLAPGPACLVVETRGSLVGDSSRGVAAWLLAHLEERRAAGSLQLGNVYRAANLILYATRPDLEGGGRWLPLVRHGVAALERLLGGAAGGGGASGQPGSGSRAQPGGGQPPPAAGRGGRPSMAEARCLHELLATVSRRGNVVALEALLASSLPWDPAAPALMGTALVVADGHGGTLLAHAAASARPAACVRLLLQAGAAPTTEGLYHAIERRSPKAVAALLAGGALVGDTRRPDAFGSWSCPIHRTLHYALPESEAEAALILEVLRGAGFRPTVYRDACMPEFLWPSSHDRVLPVLDPFDFYHPAHSEALGLPTAGFYRARPPPSDW